MELNSNIDHKIDYHLSVVILAAGQGTRMRSDLPKVLHTIGGKPLLAHVIDTAIKLNAARVCVVHGHGGDCFRAKFANLPINWVEQIPQLGTGHAVAQALPYLPKNDIVVILYGDVPLISVETLNKLFNLAAQNKLALLTTELTNPTGYGRILRDELGQISGIIEEKDATPEHRLINEINTGILAVNSTHLTNWIKQLNNHNSQGEYYLTDIVQLAVNDGIAVATIKPQNLNEVLGVNNRIQLAELERAYQLKRAYEYLAMGVTLRDPHRFDLRGELTAERDVEIDIDVILEGQIQLGKRVRIGPYCYLKNVIIADDTEIRANSILEDVKIGANCVIGPFSRLRPGTEIANNAHIGNFVEIKNSQIAAHSKVNHLSYIGDTKIGSGVNIGAGTITCNYDGANKHRTVIGDHAFIGSNTALVAPVAIGEHATIGAGSVITRNAPSGELTLTRAKQETLCGWQRPIKKN